LDPRLMLAAIGQGSGELPDAYAHACAFHVEVALAYAITVHGFWLIRDRC